MNFSKKNHEHKNNNRCNVSKTIILIIAFILSITFANAQETEKGQTITVNIDKLQSEAGHIIVALHTEATFMKGDGIKNAKSKIVDGKVTVTFENVEAGEYAILVLHDANDNNQMDFEPNGMPKESFGASNNSMSFGPPQFSSAKFDVTNENLEMKIIL